MTAPLVKSAPFDPFAVVRSALPEVPRSEAHRDEVAIRRWQEAWARRHGIVTTDAEWARLDAQRMPALAARFYPACRTVDDAQLACAWLTFFHAFDDRFDDPPLSHDPRAAEAMVERFLRAISAARAGEAPGDVGDPLLSALRELLPTTLEPMGPAWRAQLLDELDEWLRSYVVETMHRAGAVVLTPAALVAHKRACMAVPPCARLFERVHLGEVAPVVRERLAPLVDRASDLTGAINDIVSLEKERERGDNHNLIQAFLHHEGLSETEAVAKVVRWIADWAAEMQSEIEALPRQPELADHRADAARWAADCGAFVRGYFAWVLESGRFGHQPA